MDEQNLFYPPQPSGASRWCTKGQHWVEPDGRVWHHRSCPNCRAKYALQRHRRNAEYINGRRREVRATDEAWRNNANRYGREYYAARSSDPAWKEHHNRLNKAWKARNPEKVNRNTRNRRARKHGAVCQHGPGCFDAAARLMPQRCAVKGCRRTDINADHIVPIARGGQDCRWNLQPLCGYHNQSKNAADPVDWQLRHGLPAGVQLAI